jgi:hypothetical protein
MALHHVHTLDHDALVFCRNAKDFAFFPFVFPGNHSDLITPANQQLRLSTHILTLFSNSDFQPFEINLRAFSGFFFRLLIRADLLFSEPRQCRARNGQLIRKVVVRVT